MDACVARQPIFMANKRVYGYELLFRDGISGLFPDIDGQVATSRVLSDTFLEMGIDKVTGNKKAFVNFSEQCLTAGFPELFPKDILVVEILEDVSPDDKIISVCRDLAGKGYTIALDDFVYREELEPLIATAHIIKFDFRLASMEKLADDISVVSGRGLKLLAEKVETPHEFKKAVEVGFDYFQGFFFSKPDLLRKKTLSPSKIALVEMVAEVNNESFRLPRLEKMIARDISISYKLMRYVNSAFFRRIHEVSSIRQAVALLGEKEIRRFVSFIAMTDLAAGKPHELIRDSIVRAVFCELTALKGGITDGSEHFTMGLFSVIDAILDQPMEEIMENLPLGKDLKDALTERAGRLAVFLSIVEFYISADWQRMEAACGELGIDHADMGRIYLDSVRKADRLSEIRD